MKVLLCHNYYQQAGGEDQVFTDEAQLLESHGHDVIRYTVHNDSIEQMSRFTGRGEDNLESQHLSRAHIHHSP